MKNLIVAVSLALPIAAFAQASVSSTSANTAASQSAGGNQGQSMSIDSHEVVGGTQYATSSAFAPALTSSNDTCMGSTSIGGTGYSFGFSVGSTWTDSNCMMLKNARELWNQGEHSASLALLCTDDSIRYAISVSGGVMDRRDDGAVVRRGCPLSKDEWIAKGRPMLDPATGQPVDSGTVVSQVSAPRPAVSTTVDSHGIIRTVETADAIEAHAARLGAPANVPAN